MHNVYCYMLEIPEIEFKTETFENSKIVQNFEMQLIEIKF